MVPRSLNEWSIDAIVRLLEAGTHESEEFDFKEALPHASDEGSKLRLRRGCCAFANSGGGFLVFGIVDDRSRAPRDRLVGIDSSVDFPNQFGGYPSGCAPSVHWEFTNPPIRLNAAKVIHVVYLPQSWRAPHGVVDSNGAWRFTKRTNKGTEDMSIEEIRSGFLNFYEKRLRLQLLDAELVALNDSVSSAFVEPHLAESNYSLVTHDMQTIQSVLSDTYILTAEQPALLAKLHQLRLAVNVANNKARVFFGVANLSFTNKERMFREHNEFMARANDQIKELVREARGLLAPLLAR